MKKEMLEYVCHRHICSVDKFHRMFAGLSSNLYAFRNGTLYITVHRSKKWRKDPITTAIQLAKSWHHNPELSMATRFVVTIKSLSEDPGFVFSNYDESMKQQMQAMIDNIKKAYEEINLNRGAGIIVEGPLSPAK
jgi:hypothetical protein